MAAAVAGRCSRYRGLRCAYYQEREPGAPLRTIIELIAMALDGNLSAASGLERQARAIGQGLRLLNAVMSPNLILLATDVPTFYSLHRGRSEQEYRAGAMDGVGSRLISVGDGGVACLRGAAAVVLQRHSGYYRASPVRVEER